MKKFHDSAETPIFAFDFDDTINIDGQKNYPQCGRVRPYAKEVINFLHTVGIKIIIWTSRDVACIQEECRIYDDLTPMIEFLNDNGINYDAINKSVQYAPWYVNSRKVYAHMYVDDRAFGWEERDDIMIRVLEYAAYNILGVPDRIWFFSRICTPILRGEEIAEDDTERFRKFISKWKQRQTNLH